LSIWLWAELLALYVNAGGLDFELVLDMPIDPSNEGAIESECRGGVCRERTFVVVFYMVAALCRDVRVNTIVCGQMYSVFGRAVIRPEFGVAINVPRHVQFDVLEGEVLRAD
jgi:hypothetical protein